MIPLFSFVTCFLQFSQVSGYLGNVSNDSSDRNSASCFLADEKAFDKELPGKGEEAEKGTAVQRLPRGPRCASAGSPRPRWNTLPDPVGSPRVAWRHGLQGMDGRLSLPGEGLQCPGKAALLGAEKWGNRTISRATRAHLWKYSSALLILSE